MTAGSRVGSRTGGLSTTTVTTQPRAVQAKRGLDEVTMDDLQLMGIQVETLFVHDGRERMLRTNEPDGRPAPRLFLGRTRQGHVVRFGESVPDWLADRLAAILERAALAGDPRAPLVTIEALRATLESDAHITMEKGGPAYRFPDLPARPLGAVPVSVDENADAVRDTFPWVVLPAWQPCFAVIRDGTAVSVCFTSRNGALAAEAGVNTLPELRGRGYASAATEAWGAAIRAANRIPLYSTSWDNLASQGVARRVGLIMYGADAHWT